MDACNGRGALLILLGFLLEVLYTSRLPKPTTLTKLKVQADDQTHGLGIKLFEVLNKHDVPKRLG